MKHNLKFILLFVASAVIVGAGVFFLQKESNDTQQANEQTQNTQEQTNVTGANSVEQYNGPYTVNLSSTANDGTQIDGVMKIESKDRAQMSFQSNGESVEYILDGQTFYLKTDNSDWIKFTDPEANDSQDYLENAAIDDSTINDLKNAPRLSEEQCGEESCSVYKLTEDNTESRVYVGQSSKRVQKITGESPEIGTFTFTYDYDTPFTIDIPTNAQELEIPSIPELQ